MLGRRRALIAFVAVLIGWASGFAGFGWLLITRHDPDGLSTGVLEGVSTFALLCDLTAIVLGVQAIPRQQGTWLRARTFGIVAVTLGGIGIIGALLLMLAGLVIKECRGCQPGSFYVD